MRRLSARFGPALIRFCTHEKACAAQPLAATISASHDEKRTMEEPLTEELLAELLSSPSAEDYLEHHPSNERELAAYLQELLEERGLLRKDVVRAAQLNETYGYQIFTGQRTRPGRDKVLQIAFAMGLDLRTTDRLLQAAGASRLYCKDRRDAIIMFCIDRRTPLAKVNETLFKLGEPTLDGEAG